MSTHAAFLQGIENYHTKRSYATTLHKFQTWCDDNRKEPNPVSGAEWVPVGTGNLGTMNVRTAALRAWFQHLEVPEEDLRVLKFRPYRAPAQPVIKWRSKDIILAAATSPRDKVFLATLFYSALRWEGCSNILWGKVDAEHAELETVEKRGIHRTKDSKLGPVLVHRSVIDLLRAYYETFDPRPKPTDKVFAFSYDTALRILHRAMVKAECFPPKKHGERSPGIHAVRRALASFIVENSKAVDPQSALQALDLARRTLSHGSVATTVHYLYLDRADARTAYDDLVGGS